MADYEHKAGNGSIFKNQYKENENQPDYRGSIKLQDGSDKELAAWVKQDKNGNSFLSLSISDPYKKEAETPVSTQSNAKVDDLPF
tara:strand:+ start:4611 stop:4865 length:255 start_codon:yes stop_codon:yes gene_type:complete